MKDQLPRPPVGLAQDTIPRYLLRAALDAQHRVNGFGILFRAACLAVMVACTVTVEAPRGWRVLLLAPLAIGLVLAFAEWDQKPLDRLKDTAWGPLRRLARHLVATRERAAASVSGVLEVGIGPLLAGLLFAGPWAAPMPVPARLIALVALVLYVADSLVQTTNDVGYFNMLEGRSPAGWLVLVRLLLPALVALVAFALLRTTPVDLLSTWQAAAIASLLLLAYVPMALYDATQQAAVLAHAATLADAARVLRATMASDHHLMESIIRGRAAFPGTSQETRKALQDVFFEVELMRERSLTGQENRSVAEVLRACGRVLDKRGQSGTVGFESAQAGDVRLDVTSVRLVERLVLDLVDNAVKSRAPAPRVDVSVTSPATDRATRVIDVVVRDEGPGLAEQSLFAEGSSSEQLLIQCRENGGDLQYSSSTSGTTVRASFRAENLSYFDQPGMA